RRQAHVPAWDIRAVDLEVVRPELAGIRLSIRGDREVGGSCEAGKQAATRAVVTSRAGAEVARSELVGLSEDDRADHAPLVREPLVDSDLDRLVVGYVTRDVEHGVGDRKSQDRGRQADGVDGPVIAGAGEPVGAGVGDGRRYVPRRPRTV